MNVNAWRIIAVLLPTMSLTAGPASGQGQPRNLDDPVEVLLELRRPLDLTRAQISELRRIQRALAEQNEPLLEELFAIQQRIRTELTSANPDARRRDLRPTDAQLAAFRGPMERIQENNVAAMEGVNALLTDDQKRRAAILLRMRDRRRDWREWRPDWPRFPGGDDR